MLWGWHDLIVYTLLLVVADVLLWREWCSGVVMLTSSTMVWSLPPLPNLEISENTVVIITDVLHQWINHTISIAHNIAIARDLKFFLKVAVSLWLVSYIGSLFEFLTLVYIGVILSLSVPVVYDKYQHFIDEKLCVTRRFIQTQYRKIDEMVLRKLPLPSNGGYPLHS
ncbi:hypothetical protein Godav_014469 [Gossypium davidsonii]|uniref:Reticulon-like protein n=1 Tax=Gossypium davidsonii TaxID=34287 RepID=A0A7J8RKU1_GOSDV|nr:hypothetical protein [Gossypium davidsonii]